MYIVVCLLLILRALLLVESLAIHPSHGINSRSRRSPSSSNIANHRQLGTNHLLSPTFLRSSARSELDTAAQPTVNVTEKHTLDDEGHSLEINTVANTINTNNDTSIILTASTKKATSKESTFLSIWPQFDDLDKRITKIALPCIANFAINPLIGFVDLFWVNRMGNALAVAGQAAANQVFSMAFWIVSVLPGVTAQLVSKANAKGDKEAVQDAVSQSLVVGFYVSLLGSILMLKFPERVLSMVLAEGAPALQYARPYLFIRSFAFIPSLITLTGISAFRGLLDPATPLKIAIASNVFNAILDPILMFPLAMGVTGAALATLSAEVISAVCMMALMIRQKLIRWSKIFRLPSWSSLQPLLKGGAALQLRGTALQVTFATVTRVTQSLDQTGVAAAAHALAINTFQLGGVVLLAMSLVAQTMVPNALIEKVDATTGKKHGGKEDAKAVVNRLMSWGFILGGVLGAVQLAMIPLIQKSSPLVEVRKAAVVPSILASVYQLINGLVFIGEGVMIGCGNFMTLSLSTVVATVGAMVSLYTLPNIYGLSGVWMSFGVFNSLRLAGVWLHQTKLGPLANANMDKAMKST
ncbi:hypothetical protein ACHAXN_008237 [Cyclotella atomus]